MSARRQVQRRGYGRPGEWQRSSEWSGEWDEWSSAVIVAFFFGMVFGVAVLAVA